MGFFSGGGRWEDKCGNMENLNKSDGKKKQSKTKKTNHRRESETALVLGGLDFERYREG